MPGSGRQRIAPLYVGDVVDAVLGAPSIGALRPGRSTSAAPTRCRSTSSCAVYCGSSRIRHIPSPVARITARLVPSLTPSLVDLLLRDNIPAGDPAEVGSAFGFSPTRFSAVWPRPGLSP